MCNEVHVLKHEFLCPLHACIRIYVKLEIDSDI